MKTKFLLISSSLTWGFFLLLSIHTEVANLLNCLTGHGWVGYLRPYVRENRQLVTYELVEFEK
jgi:hypothetical protein